MRRRRTRVNDTATERHIRETDDFLTTNRLVEIAQQTCDADVEFYLYAINRHAVGATASKTTWIEGYDFELNPDLAYLYSARCIARTDKNHDNPIRYTCTCCKQVFNEAEVLKIETSRPVQFRNKRDNTLSFLRVYCVNCYNQLMQQFTD